MQIFANNADSTLAAPVSNVALSIQVATGEGSKFPSPTGTDFFLMTLLKRLSGVEYQFEIVKCTARSGDILTVVRAQEGTTAQTYTTGDIASLRWTSAGAQLMVQRAGDTLTGALNGAAVVTLASAATVNIGAAASNNIAVTGTTTITAFDTIAAGAVRTVRFSGALTLTHNGTSLILPTGANITTTAGDTAEFLSLGSGNWQCLRYNFGSVVPTSRAGDTLTGALNDAAFATLASAATTNIGAATSNNVNITGTTTITAFDTVAAGARRLLKFAAALVLTHNGTSLILPGAANITTAAGDIAEFVSLGAGNWQCVDFTPAGKTGSGSAVYSVGPSFTGTPSVTEITLTDAATVAWDTSLGNVATVTLGGNRTFGAPTNLKAGAFYGLAVVQDGTGGRTGAWNSVFKFTAAAAPTLTTAAGGRDYFSFRSDGTNLYEQGRSQGVA